MGTYVLHRSTDAKYYFVLRATNNEIILTSETYWTRSGAESGIASVRVNSPIEARYERKTTSRNEPMFNLKAANGEVIGTSERYTTTVARDAGISAVKLNGPTSPVVDRT
jgi:uncharacterized protein YegP (UPF0339 family)